jgi:hypothetical protein
MSEASNDINSDALQLAKELTDEILEMTQALFFSGEKELEEQEVENYVNLMEEREPLIEQLTELKLVIDETMASSADFAAIKQTIAEITELDKSHLEFMQHKHKGVKDSYQKVKQGQRIHTGYNPLPGNEVSSRFDMKQ